MMQVQNLQSTDAPAASVVPFRNRVIVELEGPRMSAAGLVLESDAECEHRALREGRVVAAGENDDGIKAGDRVLLRGNCPGWSISKTRIGVWVSEIEGVIASGVIVDSD